MPLFYSRSMMMSYTLTLILPSFLMGFTMMSPDKDNLRAIINTLGSLAVIALLLCSFSASAREFYRWKDEKGTLHFTDKPPRETKFEKVKGKNRATDDDDEAEAKVANSLKDPKRCDKEKVRYNILKNNKRIQMKNRDGTQRVLTTEEVKAEIEQTKKAMDVYCN